MVAMLASRVALSCEPMKRSTLSSSIRRTADFAVSAGGPPASVKISLTCRPMMPPALLIFSAARSAQARCVGPNSDAGPLRAMKKPILKSFACAADEAARRAEHRGAGGGGQDASARGDEVVAHGSVLLVFLVEPVAAARTGCLFGNETDRA